MAYFSFKGIKVSGIACAVPKNEIKTESYKDFLGEGEGEKFRVMPGGKASGRPSEHQPERNLC